MQCKWAAASHEHRGSSRRAWEQRGASVGVALVIGGVAGRENDGGALVLGGVEGRERTKKAEQRSRPRDRRSRTSSANSATELPRDDLVLVSYAHFLPDRVRDKLKT